MKTVARSWRGLARAPLRSSLVVALLGVSMGLALVMLTVNGAFAKRLDDVRDEVGTTITVSPLATFFAVSVGEVGAGADGAVSSLDPQSRPEVDPITTEDAEKILAIDGVESVTRTSNSSLQGADTSLKSGVKASDLGGTIRVIGASGQEDGELPVSVVGIDGPALETPFLFGAKLVQGRTLDQQDANKNLALIGKKLAEANSLALGDTFMLGGEEVEVAGIYTADSVFAENQLVLPFDSAQRLLDLDGHINSLIVEAESPAKVEGITDAIRESLGEKAQVFADLGDYERVAGPLNDARDSSFVALLAALVVAVCVILFSVALVARQRVKEIGILKAVGASNWQITSQLGAETAMLSIGAAIVGALLTFPLAGVVADGLVSDPPPAGSQSGGLPGATMGQVVQFGAGPFSTPGSAPGATADTGILGSVEAAASLETFGYALLGGVVLAVIASLVPAWHTARVRTAEVLRYE